MSLLDAPVFDEAKAKRNKYLAIGALSAFVLLVVLTLAGYLSGHGWLFTNLPAEHVVDKFLTDIEQKNYDEAYAIWTHDPDWKSHAAKHAQYPEQEFIDDWTTHSPVNGPILSHHVDISRAEGSGIIVAVRMNGRKQFIFYNKPDQTLIWPSPYNLEYTPSGN
jgi:hypothetical protein